MKAVLILGSDDSVERWQFEALEIAVSRGLQIVQVVHCQSRVHRKLTAKHALYYALASWCHLRGNMNNKVSVQPLIKNCPNVDYFLSEWTGAWESIPTEVGQSFAGADIAIKFGMNLLKDPDSLPLKYGVLSYHHGDPAYYRGRPAGFYELRDAQSIVGVVVQRLSNKLDGGDVLAQGFSKVYRNSYAKTLDSVLAQGIPLLYKAIHLLETETYHALENSSSGKNYSLPNTRAVTKVLAASAWNQLERIAYGLISEKDWRVARTQQQINLNTSSEIDLTTASELPLPANSTFTADPCGYFNNGIYCEVMNRTTSLGEIARFEGDSWQVIGLGTGHGHASYPQITKHNDRHFLFPEIGSTSPPTLFELDESGARILDRVVLQGLESLRLIDATLFDKDGYWFLFAGLSGTQDHELRLWVSESIAGPYNEHPMSPISLDPRGSRMAGSVSYFEGQFYRLGQDCSSSYGDGVISHRIDQISPTLYHETKCAQYSVKANSGPHTLLFSADEIWFDYYEVKHSPLAWLPRLRRRISGLSG